MVDDAPLVGAFELNDGVVTRAVDALVGTLTEYAVVGGHSDGAEGRGGGAVAHTVVGVARVVLGP